MRKRLIGGAVSHGSLIALEVSNYRIRRLTATAGSECGSRAIVGNDLESQRGGMKAVKSGQQRHEDLRFPEWEAFQNSIAHPVFRQHKRQWRSQEDLAQTAKLSVSTIRAAENGRAGRLHLCGALRLFRPLGLTVRFFLIENPAAIDSVRIRQILRRGKQYLVDLLKRLPRRKCLDLMPARRDRVSVGSRQAHRPGGLVTI
jgi:transcriptional regulator with XRE-family HTH domain